MGKYRIATFHGKLDPQDGSREAKLRNFIYLIGNLELLITMNEKINIRVVGYEIPIEKNGRKVDILGYDSDFNPWLIELKADNSKEKVDKVVNQINGYAEVLPSVIEEMQDEFYNRFFVNLNLTNNIKKMILAPREYFEGQVKSNYPKLDNIYVCSIAKIKKVFDDEGVFLLNDKFSQLKSLTLKIENR